MKYFKLANYDKAKLLEQIKDINAQTPEQIQIIKEQILTQIPSPTPQQREQIETLFKEYRSKLKPQPQIETQEIFETWIQENPMVVAKIKSTQDDIAKKIIEKRQEQNLEPLTLESLEQEVEFQLERELQSAFHKDIMYKYHAPLLGMEPYQDQGYNPESLKAIKQLTADQVANHTTEQFDNPNSELSQIPRQGSLKLIIGYSGSGKSTALTQNIGEMDRVFGTPIEITPDRYAVIDVDNFSPFIPGWTGGARAEDVQVYGNSAQKKVYNEALERQMNVAVPLVGGSKPDLIGKITDALINGYNQIQIVLVTTPYEESARRVIKRGIEPGGRVITPLVGQTSDPFSLFEFLQTTQGKEEIYQAYLRKIKTKKLKDDPNITPDFIANKLDFNTHSTNQTTANIALNFIKTATSLEKANQYQLADKLIKLSMQIIAKYNAPRGKMKSRWSTKYKRSIDCNNPKGFSQKQYCKRKKGGGHYKSDK